MSFDFDFKGRQLAEILKMDKDTALKWYSAMKEILPKYGITTQRRVAHFLSQTGHESGNYKTMEENLNYSEKALNAVFGRYFGPAPKRNAAEYARKPEKIANYVYMDEYRSKGGQMGNVQEGDGWRFRGRGLKQLTGRNNYTAFGKSVGMTAEEAAEYVVTEKGALESACWFWESRNLNSIADSDDVKLMTKKINGGTIGLEDRQKRYAAAMKVLGMDVNVAEAVEDDDDIDIGEIGVLRKGSRGEGVKMMQEALGISADGAFGPGTERALKAWQAKHGLVADGIAGPKTLEKLLDD
jgi:putative chitinase